MNEHDLSVADYRRLLNFVGAAHDCESLTEYTDALMVGLSSVVPCDLVSYNRIDLTGGATQTFFEPQLVPRPELEEAFARLIEQHPLVREYARTGDPKPLRMSDFLSLGELHRLEIYAEVFHPLETNHQLAFSLAIDADVVIGIGLNRQAIDFTDRDMAALGALQPHLTSAFHHVSLKQHQSGHAHRRSRLDAVQSALTPRERQVLELILQGSSNRRVARTLMISERTAEKHTANLLRKVGVASRAALLALLHGDTGDTSTASPRRAT